MVKTVFEAWQQNSVTITLGLQQWQLRDRSQQLRGAVSSKCFEFNYFCVLDELNCRMGTLSLKPEYLGEKMQPHLEDCNIGYPLFCLPRTTLPHFLIKDIVPQPQGSHCDFLLFLPYCSILAIEMPFLFLSVCEWLAMTHLKYLLFFIFILSLLYLISTALCCRIQQRRLPGHTACNR